MKQSELENLVRGLVQKALTEQKVVTEDALAKHNFVSEDFLIKREVLEAPTFVEKQHDKVEELNRRFLKENGYEDEESQSKKKNLSFDEKLEQMEADYEKKEQQE